MGDTKVIEWRARGCRCVLMQAFLSPQGWRIVYPDYRGSIPNRGSGDHKWLRFPNDQQGREWRLSLDRSTWPAPGVRAELYGSREVDALDGARPAFVVEVDCAHKKAHALDPHDTLTAALLEDVAAVARSQRVVQRVIG